MTDGRRPTATISGKKDNNEIISEGIRQATNIIADGGMHQETGSSRSGTRLAVVTDGRDGGTRLEGVEMHNMAAGIRQQAAETDSSRATRAETRRAIFRFSKRMYRTPLWMMSGCRVKLRRNDPPNGISVPSVRKDKAAKAGRDPAEMIVLQ